MPRSGQEIAVPANGEVRIGISPDGLNQAPGGATTLVRERAVWLGPAGLFGIETEPDTGGSGPVCVFVSVGNEHRIGPSRLWVQLSRRLAADGFRCVRIDVNGFGDSPARDGRPVQNMSILAIDDVLDAARAVSPNDPREVVLFGLCSSGYHILEAALTLSPRGICLVNPVLIFQPPEMASGGVMDVRRRFCLPRSGLVAAARKRPLVQWLERRFSMPWRVRRPIRTVAWHLRGVAQPLRNRPGERLGDLVGAGTDVLLISNREEIQPFLETGTRAVQRAQRKERLRIEVIPTLEHALLPSRDREQVTELILDHVRTRFGRAPVR
jgi:pimeloyl-ACP methyl ester carboxylesterase